MKTEPADVKSWGESVQLTTTGVGQPAHLGDLPVMIRKDHILDGHLLAMARAGLHGGLHKPVPPHLAMAAAANSGPGKSLPIRCVVEQHGGSSAPVNGDRHSSVEPTLETDTYAILPANTPFTEIVRTALVKIGYTASEAMGAKGSVQLKSWKPLTFDSITENPDATVEDILGDLTSVATLRIRLSSQSKWVAVEEMKEKLLRFLLQHSHGVLTSAGCPVEKTLLAQITQGLSQSLPEETRDAFNKWYREQTAKSPVRTPQHTNPYPSINGATEGNTDTPSDLSLTPGSANSASVKSETLSPMSAYSLARTRMRTSFDPEHEIPRLQKWFAHNQHPTREQMTLYLNELNQLESRRGRKPLDLTNIIYWFKNARAAQRRVHKSLDTSSDNDGPAMLEVDENENETGQADMPVMLEDDKPASTSSPVTSTPAAMAPVDVPVLPNRNAVYVVQPLPMEELDEVVRIREEDMEDPADKAGTPPQDLSQQKGVVAATAAVAAAATAAAGGRSIPEGHDSRPAMPDMGCERTSTPRPSTDDQEQATDLSMRSRRDSSDSGTARDIPSEEPHTDLASSSGSTLGLTLKRKRLDEDEEGYMSSSNGGSPSPPISGGSLPTMPSPVTTGGMPPQPPHHPMQLQHVQQHALQMAAMSHALNMHYMHPASMYSPASMVSPSPYKDLGPPSAGQTSPGSMSDTSIDKKKRSRVFIDPLTEIPKLEKWFGEDTHPSSYMIEKYTEELNHSTYRQRFPRLEPKNVQLWFKNHRAKVKRARLENIANGSA